MIGNVFGSMILGVFVGASFLICGSTIGIALAAYSVSGIIVLLYLKLVVIIRQNPKLESRNTFVE